MDKVPLEFEKLLEQAKELVISDPSAKQAVAVLTSKGHVLCFANHGVTSGSTADEADFIKTLAKSGDTKVQYAVCMWDDSTLDIPSIHLRNLLVGLNPSNQETEFLLSSGEGYNVKSLKTMLPPGL